MALAFLATHPIRFGFDFSAATPWTAYWKLVTGWWTLDRMTDKSGGRSFHHPVMDLFSAVSLFARISPPVCVASVHNWPQPSCLHLTHIFNHEPPFHGFISIIVPSDGNWVGCESGIIPSPSRWIIIALRYSNDTIAAPRLMRTLILD